MSIIFLDVEASGPVPGLGVMTEFGAVKYPLPNGPTEPDTFHGVLWDHVDSDNPVVPIATTKRDHTLVLTEFVDWLGPGHHTMVSDNPAFDFMWISYALWHTLGHNPFGHSARRIGDYYAGLTKRWANTQEWKSLRVTPHDHMPVHDALGNAEAFTIMHELPIARSEIRG